MRKAEKERAAHGTEARGHQKDPAPVEGTSDQTLSCKMGHNLGSS